MPECAHRNELFDRSICACGSMHYYCEDCGCVTDGCPYEEQKSKRLAIIDLPPHRDTEWPDDAAESIEGSLVPFMVLGVTMQALVRKARLEKGKLILWLDA